ncbi:MAG: DUF4097 domain-containing protein [Ruminococcaceae bacterium]|nr:DUF4097 domain-containing protein [Oscillospiraceae bacterium]
MKKQTKLWLIAGAILIALGFILFIAAMTATRGDFSKISTANYQTNTHTIHETFRNIEIKTDTADIFFVPSEDGICKIICYEEENAAHSVSVQNETLIVQVTDKQDWFHIGIVNDSPKITVYLPENEYASLLIRESTGDIEIPKAFTFQNMDITASTGDVKNYASALENIKIKTNTGDILTENISAKNLKISVSTGKINVTSMVCEETFEINVSTGKTKLSDISCKNLISKGSTGDISMINLLASERISIERSTGNIHFDGCDANELALKTSTGDVKGTLLSDKTFAVESSTGTITVPKNTVGGKCEIATDTGDIKINIR